MAKKSKEEVEEQQEAPTHFSQTASKHPAVIAPPQPPLQSGAIGTPQSQAAELQLKLRWFIHVG